MEIRKKHSFIPLFYWRQVLGTALVFTLALTMLPNVAKGTSTFSDNGTLLVKERRCEKKRTRQGFKNVCFDYFREATPEEIAAFRGENTSAVADKGIGVADGSGGPSLDTTGPVRPASGESQAKANAQIDQRNADLTAKNEQQALAKEQALCPDTAPTGFGAFIDFIWPDHCNVFHRAAEAVNAQLTPACAGPTCKASAVEATEGLRTSAEIYKWSNRAGIVAAGAVVASEAFNSGNDKDSLEASAKMYRVAGGAAVAAGSVDIALSLKAWMSEQEKVNSINCISPSTGQPDAACTAGKDAANVKIDEAIMEASLMGSAKIVGGLGAIKLGSDSAKSANNLSSVKSSAPPTKVDPGKHYGRDNEFDKTSTGGASVAQEEKFPDFSSSSQAASKRDAGGIPTAASDKSDSPGNYGQSASTGSSGSLGGSNIDDSQGNASSGFIKISKGGTSWSGGGRGLANGVMDMSGSDGGFGNIMSSLMGGSQKPENNNYVSIAQAKADYKRSLQSGKGGSSLSIFDRIHSAIKRNMKEGSLSPR